MSASNDSNVISLAHGTATGVRYRLEDYFSLGEDGPLRRELIEGELFVSPSPRPEHQEIIFALASILRAYVLGHKLGRILLAPIDVVLSATTTVQPDIIWLPSDHPELRNQDEPFRHLPGLAIEVISPSNPNYDRKLKFRLYEEAGVPHYWLVDPKARSIEAYQLDDGRYKLSAQANSADAAFCAAPFLGLTIPTSEVFDLPF